MTTGISPITRQFSRPYLTLQEFKNAPTALDYSNLVVGGSQAAQDAELTNAITRASSYIDQYCNQVIGATIDTEQQRVRVRADGTLRVHPKYFPVVSLSSFQYGWNQNTLNPVSDPSTAWIEEQEIIVPYAQLALNQSSQGPLGFGFAASDRAETYVRYSYVNGYANGTFASNANAGATTISVANPLGIIPGEMLNIYDGVSSELVVVADTYTFGSSTVPLAAPLAYAHVAGVSISNLPAAIKEAAILITSGYLKIRGDASLTMGVTSSVTNMIGGSKAAGDFAHAEQLLKPFRRIR
jgi:hypothetical protein